MPHCMRCRFPRTFLRKHRASCKMKEGHSTWINKAENSMSVDRDRPGAQKGRDFLNLFPPLSSRTKGSHLYAHNSPSIQFFPGTSSILPTSSFKAMLYCSNHSTVRTSPSLGGWGGGHHSKISNWTETSYFQDRAIDIRCSREVVTPDSWYCSNG